MNRILEPELMEDEIQALAYSNADFSSSNSLFVNYILKDYPKKINLILDLGCGPGDVDIELTCHLHNVKILAIDGSKQMTELAVQNVKNKNLSDRIEIKKGRLPDLNIHTKEYDIITSKDLLHHIPNPDDFWYEVERLANNTTVIYVMDLIRPDSIEKAQQIVDEVSCNEPEILRIDFYNSLLAAFTIDEIKEQLKRTHLNYNIEKLGDRHFILKCYNK